MSTTTLLSLVLLAPWGLLGIKLLATAAGRAYLLSLGTKAAVSEAMAVREMGLAYTGLVFAGLALATTASAASFVPTAAAQLLVIALSAAAIAWTVSNLAPVTWAGVVSDAGLLLSVASVLLSVPEILSGAGAVQLTILFPIGTAYTVVLGYSTYLVLVRWRESRKVTN